MEHYGGPLPPLEYGPAFTAGERVLKMFIYYPPGGEIWPQNTSSHPFFVFTPSPQAPVTGSTATFCGSSMYSLRSIIIGSLRTFIRGERTYKGSQITRGRPSGGRP